MELKEIWAVPKGRMIDFFLEQGLLLKDGCFCSGELCVSVKEHDTILLCGQELQRYQVCFSGAEEAVKGFHRKFQLKFLSAGG